jgi:hypothetical protein
MPTGRPLGRPVVFTCLSTPVYSPHHPPFPISVLPSGAAQSQTCFDPAWT